MEEDKLWKITTLDSRNVALNAKTEMNDFEQLNYGSESLWEEWIWRSMKMVALNAKTETNDFEQLNYDFKSLWDEWLWRPMKMVALTT